MLKTVSSLLALALVVTALTSFSNAQDEEQKKKKGNNQLVKNLMRPFAKAELTDEQKTKAMNLIKEKSEALQSLQKEVNGMIDQEAKKKRRAAQKAAKEKGLKGKEAMQFVWKEMGMEEADLAKFQEVNKKMNQERVKIQREILGMLDDEQKKKVRARGLRGGKGGGKGKKKKQKSEGDGGQKDNGDGGQ